MPAKRSSTSRKRSSRSTLKDYEAKRDFELTSEPPPQPARATEGPLTFVIQKHDASRLHYDFRLEAGGVLVSWSVPKGPSLDPREKHLAVHVEDHPFDYGSFEGTIPKGQYGAGEVIVWDNGTYSPDEDGLFFNDRAAAERRMREMLAEGKVSITLRGKKLKGSWTLVKMQRGEQDWLLIKHKDAAAGEEHDARDDEASVLSGLTLEDIRNGRQPQPPRIRSSEVTPANAPGARRGSPPASLKPMLATLTESAFSDPAWVFEPKLDGVRAIAIVRDGETKLLSRRGLDATKQYPGVARELDAQPVNEAVFDGEIVALDAEGRPSFELLQQRLNLTRGPDIERAETDVPVFSYAFDLLFLDGFDLRKTPLVYRKALLERVLLPTERVRLLEHFGEDGIVAFEVARDHGLEGVVAKRLDSTYETGQRSASWLKVKATTSDEFVIGGYSKGQGGRSKTFGALLVGQFDEEGRLVYAGNVGSGFDDRTLAGLLDRLRPLETSTCPFAERPPEKTAATWVRPELVAEVKFAQWTSDGHLRAPVFLHLREDKPAAETQRAEVAPPPASDPPPGSTDVAGDVAEVLAQLDHDRDRMVLHAGGQAISLTNLNKELWPKAGRRRALTKRDFLVYLARVAPYVLPHLRDRPLTLTRYPNGIGGKFFFQKHWEAELPEFVDTVELYSSHNEGDQEYLICNNFPTLLWLGQLADLELHTWYSRVDREPDGHHLSTTFTGSEEAIDASLLNYPDFIVFDLDPYIYSGKEAKGAEPELNKRAFAKTCEVAFWLKDVLDSLSLSSYVKTTGKTGLHIYVPILRQLDYDTVRSAAETIGLHLLSQHPKDITMEWSVEKRAGKVFFDHNQNTRGKTLASLYSARPVPEASVSMPVRWDELPDVYPPDFTILSAVDRLERTGDLWADILEQKHDIEGLLETVEAPASGQKRSRGRNKR